MFSRLLTTVSLVLAISSQVLAHGGVQPFLGVSGTLVKSDISRLNTASPCGANIDVATSLDSATAVPAAADGSFAVTGVTFDTGSDGSESVKANVDATGGTTFTTPVTITQNGDPAPATTSVASPITATLPAGTKCTGGTAGNLCVVQFVTTAGFANCVAVSQGAAATGATASNSTAAAGAAAAGTAAAGTAAAGTAAAGTAATAAKGAKKAAGGATTKAGAAAKAAKKAAKAAKKAAKAAAAGGAAAAAPPAAAPAAAAAAPAGRRMVRFARRMDLNRA